MYPSRTLQATEPTSRILAARRGLYWQFLVELFLFCYDHFLFSILNIYPSQKPQQCQTGTSPSRRVGCGVLAVRCGEAWQFGLLTHRSRPGSQLVAAQGPQPSPNVIRLPPPLPPSSSPPSCNADSSSLIPRTIHHIWLGSSLPEACARLRESWLSRHEGWTARLWRDADVEAFGLENQEAYDAAGNFGEKSDILRYEVGPAACVCDVSFCRALVDVVAPPRCSLKLKVRVVRVSHFWRVVVADGVCARTRTRRVHRPLATCPRSYGSWEGASTAVLRTSYTPSVRVQNL